MGKKQHSKDRMYLTTSEWKHEWGGHKGDRARVPFQRLPYHCCAIAFTPFEDAVCTEDGTVFDVTNIVPYVMKYKKHPVTGQPLTLKELIHLNFHKNAEGMYDCPVTGKVFTEHTHIAAVKTSGNVYAYEALEELNIKPKAWKDLLTDEPFTRKDIIHIQDPLNLMGRTVEQFDHVKQGLVLDDIEQDVPGSNLRNVNEDMKRALGALQTAEARAAFEAGGGGKRAEALRLLAAAKNLAAQKKAGAEKTTEGNAARAASGADASTSGPAVGSRGPTASANAGEEEGDWRLRAPGRDTNPAARFRPGAATWDTEDYTTGAGKALKRKEDKMAEMVATAGIHSESAKEAYVAASKGGGAGAKGGMTPQERYEAAGHVKYIESFSSTGQMSQSFTSTYASVHTKASKKLVRKDRNPTKKGYVRLHTTLGDLNLELHCDLAPRTCENFLALCVMGYYDGTIFHRSIKNFMIQGGDPTGTGLGGESIYGKTFKDELDSRLTHSGRGILSMANSGPGTNGSQFFFAYKSCKHLDFKHSVFGRIVGGLEVLTAMERVDTDADDRPTQEIKITGVTVFTNPFQEMEDAEAAEEQAIKNAEALKEATRTRTGEGQVGKWYSAPGGDKPSTSALGEAAATGSTGGVGRYLGAALNGQGASGAASQEAGAQASTRAQQTGDSMPPPPAKKPKVAAPMSNFDAW